jgi:hypothetical protein
VPDDRWSYFSAQGMRVHPAVVLWVSAAVVLAIAVGLVLEIVFGALAAGRSAETQDHGVSRTAMVLSMTDNVPTGKDAGPATETLDVRLDSPVGGRSVTIVHVPDDSESYANDATVQILVDPRDAGYAEFPGQPFTTSAVPWGNVIPLLVGLVLVGSMIPLARKRLRAMAALRCDGKRTPPSARERSAAFRPGAGPGPGRRRRGPAGRVNEFGGK